MFLATWSSGSTFLTKLFAHYPGVFDTFEPLVAFGGPNADALADKNEQEAREMIKDILNCNYGEQSGGKRYLDHIKIESRNLF